MVEREHLGGRMLLEKMHIIMLIFEEVQNFGKLNEVTGVQHNCNNAEGWSHETGRNSPQLNVHIQQVLHGLCMHVAAIAFYNVKTKIKMRG